MPQQSSKPEPQDANDLDAKRGELQTYQVKFSGPKVEIEVGLSVTVSAKLRDGSLKSLTLRANERNETVPAGADLAYEIGWHATDLAIRKKFQEALALTNEMLQEL